MALKYDFLIEKTDRELIVLLSERPSQQVQSEFYNRFKSFLLQICRNGCKHFDGGEQLADDIFQNTMIKALNGVASIRIKISQETNVSAHIKSWLVVVARNELREFLRKNPDEKKLANPFRPKIDELEELVIFNGPDENINEQPSFHKNLLDRCLDMLSDRERHILMVYMEYYDPAQPNRHLPDEVIKQMCLKYNINSAYLRQIKRRALQKLKNFIYKDK